MDLHETKIYEINEEEEFKCFFIVPDILMERNGTFKTKKGKRIDIYIKELAGNEPHIHLRDEQGNICRIRLRSNEYQRDSYEKNNPKLAHILDKNEEKAFADYMHSIIPGGDKNDTVWKNLAMSWNLNWSSNNKGTGGLVDISKGCPSYININEPK